VDLADAEGEGASSGADFEFIMLALASFFLLLKV
jgi:hypothetical protein